MEKYTSRNEVPEKYKLDFTEYFKNLEEFEKCYHDTSAEVNKLINFIGCTKNSNKLYEFLCNNSKILADLYDLYIYTDLNCCLEVGVSDLIARNSKVEDLLTTYSINTSFFEPELLQLTKDEYNRLFEENKSLNEFKSLLDDIYRNKEHILSEEKQTIVDTLSNAMNHFDQMSKTLNDSCNDYGKVNLNGEEIELASNNYAYIMKNSNREDRKKIREQFFSKINQYGALHAGFLDSAYKANVEICKLKNYKSTWDAYLFDSKLSNKVFESLISTYDKNLDSLHNYFKLYKDVYGYDKLYMYDTVIDLVKNNKEYTIEEAQDIILKSLEPLGEEYNKAFKNIFDSRLIDYCQYKGKRGGACNFESISKESRIMLSYNGDLESVSTIAHEGGHNIHQHYINANNPLQYRDQPPIVAEVASLTNECLLSSYLSEHGRTKEEELAGINNVLEIIVSNFFGAIRDGQLEQQMYKHVEQGGSLTKDVLDENELEMVKKFYGDIVELDEYSTPRWKYVNHYYYFYYLFSYSVCISVAVYVSKHILDGDSDMLNRYMKFLSTGSDTNIIDTFKVLGVDIESTEVYENLVDYFNEMIDKFNKISKEA